VSGLVPPGLRATLVLVRHSETTWIVQDRFQGQRNPWLTARGREQAAAVARRLADPHAPPALPIPPGPPIGIWHSPLKRARDTAAAIRALVPAPLLPDERLAELAQGDWEGRSHRAVTRLGPGLAAWQRDPLRNSAPGGETLSAARPRVRAAFIDVMRRLASAATASAPNATTSAATPNPWALIVSHGGTMRLGLLLLLELPLSRFWAFPFEPAAITIIELADSQASLRAHNLMSHLGGAGNLTHVDRGGAL
jgi:ribonuclease H / adenosylcobalamin/alpha-ribazole phosphatase